MEGKTPDSIWEGFAEKAAGTPDKTALIYLIFILIALKSPMNNIKNS